MEPTAMYLDGETLQSLLSPRVALDAVRAFFSGQDRGAIAAPPRIHLRMPGRNTTGLYMPAATMDYAGVKIVHLMPERFPSVEAEIFLYDAESGKLLFWGDGKPMTALRTSAVSVAASLALLPSCKVLLVFGAGVQATAHVASFASAYPELEKVWAVTRSEESYRRLRQSLAPHLRPLLERCAGLPGALGEVDCVIATTPAAEPLFNWNDLSPRCHVVGIGSATHEMNELPPQAFLEGQVWVDTPNAVKEAGDFLAAIEMGWNESGLRGDLFDLLGGSPSGPGGPGDPGSPPGPADGRTVFKSVGHAAQDLAIMIRLWELLREPAPESRE